MHEPQFLLFASDATVLGLMAGGFMAVAIAAGIGERRRRRRRQIDAVGCMPWTTLSVLTTMIGLVLLAMAATGWLRG